MIKEHNNSTWQGKAYSKIVDTTQQVTSFPVVVRPMENAIPSWTIKGNMQQTGTPTPSSPIQPSETGERTGNLFDWNWLVDGYQLSPQTGLPVEYERRTAILQPIKFSATGAFLSFTKIGNENVKAIYSVFANDDTLIRRVTNIDSGDYLDLSGGNKLYIAFYDSFSGASTVTRDNVSNIMLNTGSQPLPYQPYGYVLPIKSGNTTTPVYLGEVQSTRNIVKLVLTGQETGWEYYSITTPQGMSGYFRRLISSSTRIAVANIGVCSHFRQEALTSQNAGTDIFTINAPAAGGNGIVISPIGVSDMSVNDFKTYLAAQYAAGTPVCVWYVLATPQTAVVNEPLRKIGTYSDSVSGTNLSVTAQSPTTIDVDTSLKPSEMDLTYTGVKMCKRKRKSANLFDYTTMATSITGRYLKSDGTTQVEGSWNISDYIPCDGTNFVLSKVGGNAPSMCFYDNNKQFISGVNYNTGGSQIKKDIFATASNNAKYIRFSYMVDTVPDDLSAIMLVEGSTAPSSYAPYWE